MQERQRGGQLEMRQYPMWVAEGGREVRSSRARVEKLPVQSVEVGNGGGPVAESMARGAVPQRQGMGVVAESGLIVALGEADFGRRAGG